MSPKSSGPFVLQTQEDLDGSSGSDRRLDERLLSRQTPALECLNAFSYANKDVHQLNEEPVSTGRISDPEIHHVQTTRRAHRDFQRIPTHKNG